MNKTGAEALPTDEGPPSSSELVANLIVRGHEHLARRELNEALAAFDRAVALAPDDPEAVGGRAEVLFRLDQYARSVEDFSRALALRPNAPDLYLGRA